MSTPIGVLKIVVVGDESVGKSTLLDSWTEEKVVVDPVSARHEEKLARFVSSSSLAPVNGEEEDEQYEDDTVAVEPLPTPPVKKAPRPRLRHRSLHVLPPKASPDRQVDRVCRLNGAEFQLYATEAPSRPAESHKISRLFPATDLIVLCFSLVNRQSYLRLRHQLRKIVLESSSSHRVLVACQADRLVISRLERQASGEAQDPISCEEIAELAVMLGAEDYIELPVGHNLTESRVLDTMKAQFYHTNKQAKAQKKAGLLASLLSTAKCAFSASSSSTPKPLIPFPHLSNHPLPSFRVPIHSPRLQFFDPLAPLTISASDSLPRCLAVACQPPPSFAMSYRRMAEQLKRREKQWSWLKLLLRNYYMAMLGDPGVKSLKPASASSSSSAPLSPYSLSLQPPSLSSLCSLSLSSSLAPSTSRPPAPTPSASSFSPRSGPNLPSDLHNLVWEYLDDDGELMLVMEHSESQLRTWAETMSIDVKSSSGARPYGNSKRSHQEIKSNENKGAPSPEQAGYR